MDDEAHQELHAAIQHGDVEVVTRLLQEHSEEQYFSYEETSALFKAFSCEEYDIVSYLIRQGAKIHDYEVYDLYRLEIDLTRLNHLLSAYNKKTEKSCVFQLVSWSQSPQGLDGERLSAIVLMYEVFFKSEIIKLLMKVLEYEAFDIVFDFSSDDVNRVYRLYKVGCEAYGLTLSNSKEIFIGAKNMLSGDPRKRAKVYGVVAEELCHLALTTIFENIAKPFREEDSKLHKEFWAIVLAVQSSSSRSCHVESVIKDVFVNYEYDCWECELIARVPHVVGIYGEAYGRKVFLETPELSKLLLFYDQNVLPKCREYSDPSLNTKPYRMMAQLTKKNEFISFTEKTVQPLKEGFGSFRDYLVDVEGISVIVTNCTKLCTLQVYHELKREHTDQLDKKCLFFSWKSFEMDMDKILNAFKGKVWEYLILVVNEKEMNPRKFENDYIYSLDDFKMEGIKIIIISQSFGGMFEKAVNYKWEDLTDEYQYYHQIIRYVFKGEEDSILVLKESFPDFFNEEDIIRIVGGEVVELCGGDDLYSQGYNQKTYIDREFKALTVDRKIFENMPFDASVFLSGLSRYEFRESLINENQVQWLNGSDDDIRDDKSIFIVNDMKRMSFTDFVGKNPRKRKLWLHHENGVFYLRKSSSHSNDFKRYLKEETLSEKKMLDFLKRKRIAIISDNAGYGKSTVVSSLIRGLNEKKCLCWRVDFKKFSKNAKDPCSIAHITENSDEEEVFDHLFLMLGIDTSLERHLFRVFSKRGDCFIFFDGFDEVPSKYKDGALLFLSTLSGKANLIVTTRKHHQLELEQLLNTYSHQLVPFSREDRVRYLGNLWKSEMKYPNGETKGLPKKDQTAMTYKIKKIIRELKKEKIKLERYHQDLVRSLEKIQLQKSLDFLRSEIDALDFSELAENVVNKALMDKESLEFMGIPLHLYMVGIIHYIGNFNVEIQSDIHSLYSDFIEQKILIYLEEKEELKEGLLKDKNQADMRKDAYRIHIQLANQLMCKESVQSDSNKDEEDLELCSALGIVFIHAGEVHFVHQTFAEFFKAESLRQKINKDVFVDVLMEKRYNLVRRFLSSALKKKNFENIARDFFQDVDFLVGIMRKIMDIDSRLHESNSGGFCMFEIVKKLLEKFEAVGKELVDEFVEGLYGLVMGRFEKSRDNCLYPMRIGGCLTVLMIKDLVNKNFVVNSVIVLNFVRSSENLQEVTDVLQKCISHKKVGESGSSQVENRESENSEFLGLSELLTVEDSDGKGLLYHALWNNRTETFAQLLKFPRHVLGKDQFVKAIVRSYEYKSQMKTFMKHERLSIVCQLFKDLHSVFGDELESLVDTDLKMLFINRAAVADDVDESGGPFENATSLFRECFGIEKLKELFMSRDSEGHNVIRQLIFSLSDGRFMKVLKAIENILGEKMKQFLKIMDRQFRNVMHFAALKGDVYFHDLLQLFSVHLNRTELREMLLSADNVGNNVVHLLVVKNSSETLMKNFRVIKEALGNAGWFQELLKSKGESSKNIFHLASIENVLLEDLVRFCNDHLDEGKIKEMLISSMKSGDNVIHLLVLHNSPERLRKNLQLLKETFVDENWFKHFLTSKGQNAVNVFHLAAFRDACFDDLMQFCSTHFSKDEMYEMLCSRDIRGDQLIHLLVAKNSSVTLIKHLNLIKRVVGEKFQLMLNSKGQSCLNILHVAAFRDIYLDDLLQFCSANLGKDGIKKLLVDADQDGNHVLHRLVVQNSSKTLIKNMKLVRKVVGDDRWLGQLLKTRSKHSVSILHFASMDDKHLRGLLQLCDSLLGKEEIKGMLLGANGEVDTLFTLLFLKNSPEILLKNLNSMKEVLGGDWLKDFLKKKSGESMNVLHYAAGRDMRLHNLLPFLWAHVEEADIKELFLGNDADGYNVIHLLVLNNSPEILKENLKVVKEILGRYHWFKDMFWNKAQDDINILQLSAYRNACLDDLLCFLGERFQENEIKEMILSRDADGDNLLHYLVLKNTSETLMKNLHAIRNILGDDAWFRDLLKTKDQSFKNLFHLVSLQDIYLADLLGFCDQLLSKDELKEMFSDSGTDEYNVIHSLVLNNNPDTLIKNLNLIRDILGNAEWFKELIKSRGRASQSNIHIATFRGSYLGDLLQFFRHHLEEDEMEELIFSTDADADNVLHFLVLRNSPQTFMKNMSLLRGFLGEDKFEGLLKSRGKNSLNVLHVASIEGKLLHQLLQFCKAHLSDGDFKEMILGADKFGDGMVHTLALQNTSESLVNELKFIREMFGDEACFKELLISKGEHSYNILQLASHADACIVDLLRFCKNHLEKDAVKEMILSFNDYGVGLIHLLVMNNSSETLVKNLTFLKEFLGDEDFQDVLKSEGRNSLNVLQLASTSDKHLGPLLRFFQASLDGNVMKDLILSDNGNGENAIDLLATNNSSETLMKNLKAVREILGDEEWFNQALMCKGVTLKKMIQSYSINDARYSDLLQHCAAHIDEDEMKEILLVSNEYKVTEVSSAKNFLQVFVNNLKVVIEVVGDEGWFKSFIRSKLDCFKNMCHLASAEELCLGELLCFCGPYLEKEEVEEMLLETDADGRNVIHSLFLNNSSEMLTKNLKIIKEILGDECFKVVLKSNSLNILHAAADRDIYLAEILQFYHDNLEADEIKSMLRNTDELGNNVIHQLVLNNSSETLMKNLRFIERTLEDEDWFKELLRSVGQYSVNVIHLAVFRDHLGDLMQFYDARFDKIEIKEMLLNADQWGENAMHHLVLNNSPEMLTKNLECIAEVLGNEEWVRELLSVKTKGCVDIPYLAATRDFDLEGLLKYLSRYFVRGQLKEILSSSDPYGKCVTHLLASTNSIEMLMKNLTYIEDVIGENDWFIELLGKKCQRSKNILHFAAMQDKCLTNLLPFLGARFEKGEIKEMLSSVDADGNGVVHYLASQNSSEGLKEALVLMRDIAGNEFKQFLNGKTRNGHNIFHLAASRDMYLRDLLQFVDSVLEKDEIKELLLSRDRLGDNVMHLLVQNNSQERLIKNLKVLSEILGADEGFKELLKSENQNSLNVIHIAASEDKHIIDLLLFLKVNLDKDETREMIFSRDCDGENVMHYLVLRNSSEILTKNLNLIWEVLDDCVLFKELLKSKARKGCNVLHLASMRDVYLGELFRFFDGHLEKDELKEMLLWSDELGDSPIHLLVRENSPETMINNLGVVKETLGDDELFKEMLKSKGQSIRSVFHFTAVQDKCFRDLLRFLDAHLEKDELKEVLLSVDRENCGMIHLLMQQSSSETLIKNLRIIKDVLEDENWFKDFLLSEGLYSRSIFHYIAFNRNEKDFSFLRWCLSGSEIADLVTRRDENGYTCLHCAACYPGNVPVLLNYAREVLSFQISRFDDLVLAENVYGNTFLHDFEENFDSDSGTEIFDALREELSDEVYNKLLRARNKQGQTFLQVEKKIQEELIKCCAKVLEQDLFMELL